VGGLDHEYVVVPDHKAVLVAGSALAP
jgi:hypothetical protein